MKAKWHIIAREILRRAIGKLIRSVLQGWVRWTGKRVHLAQASWLEGFWAHGQTVGPGILQEIIERHGLLAEWGQCAGLLSDFDGLGDQSFAPEEVDAEVHRFYENTAGYSLSARPRWYQPFFWMAALLISTTCRVIDQFNLPLNDAQARAGMTHDVVRLRDWRGRHISTCWLRRSGVDGRVVFAGFYGMCQAPLHKGPLVKVVFPVPDGYICVLLEPTVHPDGGLELVSAGRGFGDAGFYWVQRTDDESVVRVKYVPLEESIHVYVDEKSRLRTHHQFFLWGIKFLSLRYEMERVRQAGTVEVEQHPWLETPRRPRHIGGRGPFGVRLPGSAIPARIG